MRYAVISDIHSNLEAMKAFLELIPEYKIEKVICLGDIVGYNTNPDECAEILSMLRNIEIVRGNHDRAFTEKRYDDFSEHARAAIVWTIKNCRQKTKDFIAGIKKGPKIIDGVFAVCHGSPLNEDAYIFNKSSAGSAFNWMLDKKVNTLFFGHTHWQKLFVMNKPGEISEITSKKIKIKDGFYYLLNPGSIGQPRDRDNRAAFMIFDDQSKIVEPVRFNYSFQKTQEKILANGLPRFLAERLASGI
jgi:predicted phosphodiesterase